MGNFRNSSVKGMRKDGKAKRHFEWNDPVSPTFTEYATICREQEFCDASCSLTKVVCGNVAGSSIIRGVVDPHGSHKT